MFNWGDFLSQDFINEIPPTGVSTREWYQCIGCLQDVRSGKHLPDCPADPQAEADRVSYVLRVLHKNKGLTVRNGGAK